MDECVCFRQKVVGSDGLLLSPSLGTCLGLNCASERGVPECSADPSKHCATHGASKETAAIVFTTLLKVTGNRFLFRRKQINFYLRSERADLRNMNLLLNTSCKRAASAPKCEPRQSRCERSTRARSEALFLCHGHGQICFIESENVGQLRSAAKPMPRRGYTFTVTALTRAKVLITSRELFVRQRFCGAFAPNEQQRKDRAPDQDFFIIESTRRE